MFGKTMMIECRCGIVTLKPFSKEEIGKERVVDMLADAEVTQYLNMITSPTIQDEEEWWEKVRKNERNIVWGIYLDGSELLGVTSLNNISQNHSAMSGFLLFDKGYWRKGIASTSHIARTYYASYILNLKTITSAVISPNIGSFKALQSVGYFQTGYVWGTNFINGKFRGVKHLQWINPKHTRMFFEDGIPQELKPALKLARKALKRAEKDVVF